MSSVESDWSARRLSGSAVASKGANCSAASSKRPNIFGKFRDKRDEEMYCATRYAARKGSKYIQLTRVFSNIEAISLQQNSS
jgi:hypothetical protein